MTMRFQAFLVATILMATAIIAVAAGALADQNAHNIAKSDRRVGEIQFASESPTIVTPTGEVIVARVSD